jgi:hypothetical protein
MARRSSFARIGLCEDPREFKLLTLERWISFQDFVFGRAPFEHTRDLIRADSGSANARFTASDLRIFYDALKARESRSHLIENALEV